MSMQWKQVPEENMLRSNPSTVTCSSEITVENKLFCLSLPQRTRVKSLTKTEKTTLYLIKCWGFARPSPSAQQPALCQQQDVAVADVPVTGAESDHTKESRGKKANGRAIHRPGNHTITLTVFLPPACSLPFSFTNFWGEKIKKKLSLFCFLSSHWHFLSIYRFSSSLCLPLPLPFFQSLPLLPPSSSSSCWLI